MHGHNPHGCLEKMNFSGLPCGGGQASFSLIPSQWGIQMSYMPLPTILNRPFRTS